MKRILCLIALLTLATAATAQVAVEKPDCAGADAVTIEPLFAAVPDGAEGERGLTVEYLLEGETLFTEELVYESRPGDGTAVVGLLAYYPFKHDHFTTQRLRERMAVRIDDGVGVRQLSMPDLIVESRRLLTGTVRFLPSHPAHHEGRLLVDAAGELGSVHAATTYEQCVSQCDDILDFCLVSCGSGPACDDCEARWRNCVEQCPEDCTGPTVEEYYQFETLGYTLLEYGRCIETYPLDPTDDTLHKHDYYRIDKRRKTIRKTTQCDGSFTEEVVAVYDYSTYCWKRQPFNTCSFELSDNGNYCRF